MVGVRRCDPACHRSDPATAAILEHDPAPILPLPRSCHAPEPVPERSWSLIPLRSCPGTILTRPRTCTRAILEPDPAAILCRNDFLSRPMQNLCQSDPGTCPRCVPVPERSCHVPEPVPARSCDLIPLRSCPIAIQSRSRTCPGYDRGIQSRWDPRGNPAIAAIVAAIRSCYSIMLLDHVT